MTRLKFVFSSFVGILLMLQAACAVNPVTGRRDFVLMTQDQEIALGRKMHAEVLKSMPRYKGDALAKQVQRIGDRLAWHSHRNDLVYRFTIVDSAQINAFALPGGYIYITRGLLAYLNSEAELAAVLAHEIGHVTARHSVRQQSASMVAGVLGAIVNARIGVQGSEQITQVVSGALLKGYGRSHELESDRLGAEYLARSGYDPQAMMAVIRILKNQELYAQKVLGSERAGYHGLFASHPDNDTRLQEVIAAAEGLRKGGRVRVGRDAYLKWIDGLVFGDSEEQGVRRRHYFYHKGLDLVLRFPQGWQLMNESQRVWAHTADGDAEVQFSMQDINRRISPREFMIKRMGLKELFYGRGYKVNGLPAYTAMAWSDSSFGRRFMRFAVVFRGDQALIFSGVSRKQGEARRYDQELLDLAGSVRGLRRSEQHLASAQRIHLLRANKQTRLSQLAQKSPIPDHAEDQLRLLNALYPKGEPHEGEWVKIVQ